jgi:hypothetical protein
MMKDFHAKSIRKAADGTMIILAANSTCYAVCHLRRAQAQQSIGGKMTD